MRCVCKSWNALLSDSSFVKSHLHRSIQNNDEILLLFDMVFSFEYGPSPFTARPSCSPDLELSNFIKPPTILKYKYGCGFLIGSMNGLICFFYGSTRDGMAIYIWNPFLSAVLSLPPFPLGSGRLHFGFGFDPKTDDYKILKLTSFSEPPSKVNQVEVYSMRKSSGKVISPQTFPSHITILEGHHSQVCVDDHLHWLGTTDLDQKTQTIVAFDLGAEIFSEISLPDSLLHHLEDRLIVLGVLGGKLCVISRVRDGKCEVWVMEAYRVAKSWVKHHVFPPFSGDIVPYGFTSYDEFLFQVGHDDDRFGLYDPIAAKTKTFKIRSRNSSIMKFAEYVDSLVWIEHANRLQI